MTRIQQYGAAFGLLGFMILGTVMPVTAQIQKFDNGAVNWRRQIVRAIGIGAPDLKQPKPIRRAMAIRAAKLVAVRNAMEMVNGIHLTSETTVRNFMTESDVIRSRVEGIVKDAQFGEPAYYEDGSVEIEVTVPLTGVLLEALVYAKTPSGMTGKGEEIGWIVPGGSAAASQPAMTPAQSQPVETPAQDYTGLIIDTRGLKVRPALSPKVIGTDGVEYYSAATVTREYALKMGVSGYAKDPETATQDPRVGSNPLVISAKQAAGTNHTDVVISEADAMRVRQANETGKFLAECRLIILVD